MRLNSALRPPMERVAVRAGCRRYPDPPRLPVAGWLRAEPSGWPGARPSACVFPVVRAPSRAFLVSVWFDLPRRTSCRQQYSITPHVSLVATEAGGTFGRGDAFAMAAESDPLTLCVQWQVQKMKATARIGPPDYNPTAATGVGG